MTTMWAEVTTTVKVAYDPKILAQVFASLDDEAQAQFFIDVAAHARQWPKTIQAPSFQWVSVSRHLAECTCSNDDARELVRLLGSHL
jgi:hypothetical protein